MDPRFALSLFSFLPVHLVRSKLTSFDASLLFPSLSFVLFLFLQVADPPFILHMSIGSESYVSRPKYAPQGTSRLERLEKDLEQARKLAQLLEEEEKESVPEGLVRGSEKIDELGREAAKLVESREAGGSSIEQKKQLVSSLPFRRFRLEPSNALLILASVLRSLEQTKFKLDLYILYLRRAFFTCYYSASVNDSVEELERRSIQYLRRVPSVLTPASAGKGDKEKTKKKPSEEVEEEGEERKKEAVVVPMKVDDEDGDVAVFEDEVEEVKGGKGGEVDTVLKDRESISLLWRCAKVARRGTRSDSKRIPSLKQSRRQSGRRNSTRNFRSSSTERLSILLMLEERTLMSESTLLLVLSPLKENGN